MPSQSLDTDALRKHVGPKSKWAQENGARIAKRRTSLGFTVRDAAVMAGVPVQTMYRIESGDIVPRDYLRLTIAHVLDLPVDDLFPMPDQAAIAEFRDEAA